MEVLLILISAFTCAFLYFALMIFLPYLEKKRQKRKKEKEYWENSILGKYKFSRETDC